MNQWTKYSAVIFDMDGLMLDTEKIAQVAWQRAAVDWDITIPDDVYLQVIGRTLQDTEDIFMKAFGADFPFHEVRQRRLEYTDAHIAKHGISVKPGLLELLDFLDECALPKAVATSTHEELAVQKLTVSDLVERFDVIVCGDHIQNGKPAPDIFLTTAKRLQVLPERCIVLEDSDAGIRAAHNAGMTPIMIPDIKQPSEEIMLLAHRVFLSLHEVIPFLQKSIETSPHISQ